MFHWEGEDISSHGFNTETAIDAVIVTSREFLIFDVCYVCKGVAARPAF